MSLEICTVLEYCLAYSGNSVPTFWDDLSVLSSRIRKSQNVGRELHSTLRNIPEEHRSHVLISHTLCHLFTACQSVPCSSVLYIHQTVLSVTVSSREALDWYQEYFLSKCDQCDGEFTWQESRRGSGVFVAVSASKQLCSWQLDLCTWRSVLP